MTAFYATTYFYQNNQEFRCTWDLYATKHDPSADETIQHLTAMLSENFADTWNLDEDNDSYQFALDLHGLSPEEFSRELVLNEVESQGRFGVTWKITTEWEAVDSENYEHPCNL